MDATTLKVLRRHRSDDRARSARVAGPPAARSTGEARSSGTVSIDLTGAHVSKRRPVGTADHELLALGRPDETAGVDRDACVPDPACFENPLDCTGI